MFVYLGNINYLVINIELVFVNIVYFNRKFSKLKNVLELNIIIWILCNKVDLN